MTDLPRRTRGFVLFLFIALIPSAAPGLGAQEVGLPLTAAERSEYRQTTGYDDLMAFVREVTGRGRNMHLTSMGQPVRADPCRWLSWGKWTMPRRKQ